MNKKKINSIIFPVGSDVVPRISGFTNLSVKKRLNILISKEDMIMINWNNMDTLASYQELLTAGQVNLAQVMAGESGAERVKK